MPHYLGYNYTLVMSWVFAIVAGAFSVLAAISSSLIQAAPVIGGAVIFGLLAIVQPLLLIAAAIEKNAVPPDSAK
jgi:hypothetical protein